jgi:aryl-alcohol dehydrogenase-like predicted oxidoreductase
VERINAIAAEKNCKPSELALTWVLAQGEDIVTIPGTKRRSYLEKNLDTLNIQLTDNDLNTSTKSRRVGGGPVNVIPRRP